MCNGDQVTVNWAAPPRLPRPDDWRLAKKKRRAKKKRVNVTGIERPRRVFRMYGIPRVRVPDGYGTRLHPPEDHIRLGRVPELQSQLCIPALIPALTKRGAGASRRISEADPVVVAATIAAQ